MFAAIENAGVTNAMNEWGLIGKETFVGIGKLSCPEIGLHIFQHSIKWTES